MIRTLIIIGYDGYSKSVIESVMQNQDYDEILVLDDKHIGETFGIARVVAGLNELELYYHKGYKEIHIAKETCSLRNLLAYSRYGLIHCQK